ncbi:hypothetical protein D8M04_07015 [Oceanobacillus piezotolerans]|uniref:Zinc chelation protein SecC n=1 Tax=Oceanobacillus piezotolerans TaxID=2448030 RepID=A0A498DE45_9BACI|nr:SEC-C metal-binding domain-containing protein [Oceanobacillus piezotolerans]RLL46940.1 hypothetical protein D8M04_07015 [Oceanobacillus piezotolerans]
MYFLNKVEPYILSDDITIRDFALEAIENSFLATEDTFMLAFQALDKLPPNQMSNPIIPFTRNAPVTEKVLQEVIRRLEKKDLNFQWYLSILDFCPTALLVKYEKDLEKFVDQKLLKHRTRLHSLDTESLFMEAGEVMHIVVEKDFDIKAFQYGKRIFRELIARGEYDENRIYEIKSVIQNELEEDNFTIDGVYNVFLAGEQRVEQLVPMIAGLLVRMEEDILIEEVVDALIKIGSVSVLHELEKYIENEDTAFAAIEVIGNIKHPIAEEILLRYFDQATDITIKTVLAEALCLQLSSVAVPKIVELLETGYDEELLDLTECVYPVCIINDMDHPKLDEWRKELQQSEVYWEQFKKEHILKEAKEQGVGRNDPCICGSGRKFKKCCGA